MDTLFLGLRVLVSLGAVLGLLWFLQRRFSRTLGSAAANPAVRVVSRQPLTPKASVVVVESEGQRFLLGVTEGSVNVLHTSELPELPDVVPGADADFAASLKAASIASSHEAYPMPPRRAGRGAHALPLAQPEPATSALAGSILAPDTWRQAAAALRRGRRG